MVTITIIKGNSINSRHRYETVTEAADALITYAQHPQEWWGLVHNLQADATAMIVGCPIMHADDGHTIIVSADCSHCDNPIATITWADTAGGYIAVCEECAINADYYADADADETTTTATDEYEAITYRATLLRIALTPTPVFRTTH